MGANAFGQGLNRKEDRRLVSGQGRYTDDLALPGLVHAAMLRSPHVHARILAIDTAAARAAPGVLAVLTGADWEEDGLGGIPPGETLARFPGVTPEEGPDHGYAFRPPPRPPLARVLARFAGDSVAMVVAETVQQARDAAELIAVEYETLPAAVAPGPDAPPVWAEAPDNVCFRWSAGDAEAVARAFARAHRVVRLDAVNNRIHVGALETRGAIGEYADGRWTLRTGSQMPHALRDALADDVFRVPRDRVRVLVADVGGSFGIKNALYPEQALVLWAARRVGRPVKWIGDRADGFLSDYHARDNISTAELALDAEGNFLGLRVATVAPIGAYLAPEGQLSPTANTPALAGVYRLPCIHVRVTGVFTHTAPTSVYRGAGRPEAIHLVERLVDRAARETGADRIALRRRNLLTPAELPFRTGLGLTYDSGDFPALLDRALARADHAGFAARRAASEARGRLRGFGIAHYCERVAGGWAEDGWVELHADGSVVALTGTMSNGQGHETAFAQLVADRLGLDPSQVQVVQGDTDRVPAGKGTGGSASLSIGGAALDVASGDLVRQTLPYAADALEAAAADVGFEDGMFRILGTDRAVGWGAVAARLGRGGAPAALTGAGHWRPNTPTFPNGCHVAEVEIDPETGAATLCAYTMVHDFGRVLNPKLLEGQLQGGVAQGIGQAACERVVYDESGQNLTGSLMDYALPRADELPPLRLETAPTEAPSHPLGMKGCGEAGAAGAPPALMNALLDALAPLGVAHLEMPATPERIWRAIGAGQQRRPDPEGIGRSR